MKTALIAGVCLLALTITTTDAVSKKQNCTPNLDILACLDGFDINSETVCTDDCRTALTEYYDDCVPAGADAFKTGYALLCENIGCIPDLELKACLDGYTTNSETVCTDDCMTALTEYYDDCVSTGGDAFKIGYIRPAVCTRRQLCYDSWSHDVHYRLCCSCSSWQLSIILRVITRLNIVTQYNSTRSIACIVQNYMRNT